MNQRSLSFEFEDFSFNAADRVLTKPGRRVRLTPKASELLLALLEKQGDVVTKDELKRSAWSESHVTDDNLHRKMTELRQALGETPEHRYIETIAKSGYRFLAPAHLGNEPLVRDRPAEAASVPTEDVRASPSPPVSAGQSERFESRGNSGVVRRSRRLFIVGVTAIASLILLAVGLPLSRKRAFPEVGGYWQITHDGRPKDGPLIVDGSRIYFTETVNLRSTLAMATASGDVSHLDPPMPHGDAQLFDFDPRSNELLIMLASESGLDRQLWTWTPGGTWGKLLGLGFTEAATFSPDGSDLALLTNVPSLDLVDRTSLRVLRRHPVGSPSHWIRYAPGGTALRFAISLQARSGSVLWGSNAWGDHSHRIEPDNTLVRSVRGGTWSPDGRWFVFDGEWGNNQNDLWVAPDRFVSQGISHGSQLLTHAPIRFQWPANASDRRHLFVIGTSRRSETVRYSLATQDLHPLLGPLSAVDVSFSYDGRSVAYIDNWNNTLWRADADGHGAVQLTFPPMEAHQPHWSPDGQRIAFMGTLPQRHWRAYIIPARGGSPSAPVEDDNEQGVPSWSGDGRQIIFGDRLYQRPLEQMRLHLWDVEAHRLTDLPDSNGRWSARWSPDGRFIAAQSPNFQSLYLYDIASRTWTELAKFDSFDCLNWSRDSEYIYFLLRDRPKKGCYRIAIADRKLEQLLAFEDHPDLDPSFLSVAPDGSPVFDRIIATQEIYAIDVRWP